jgi:hypothetical protein
VKTTQLREAYDRLLAVAEAGGFGAPPAGEWDAARLLAHLAATDASIASAALAIACGQRPAYDNRVTLDEWNLQRIVAQAGGAGAGDLAGLVALVRRNGDLLCTVAEQLDDADLAVPLHILIISKDQVMADEPRPLRFLIEGVGQIHLPMHTDQLRSLRG